MSNAQFTDIRACVFDAYGTLFDVHAAAGHHRPRLGDKADRVSEIWRAKQLQYTWLRSLMGRYVDFWQVTEDALDYAFDTCDIEDPELKRDLMEAYRVLDAYTEVPDVLRRLKDMGMTTAILSNGSPAMLDSAAESAGIKDLLDAILSVDVLGIYKPHPSVYQLAVDRLEVKPEQISFQSSNAWDAAAAAAFGMRVAWVNRFGQARERIPAEPHAELETLHELPELVSG